MFDIRVASQRDDTPVLGRKRLHLGVGVVYGHDIAVAENEVGFLTGLTPRQYG